MAKKTKRIPLTAKTADHHILYEESVQCVEADVDFLLKTFRRKRNRPLRTLKEDFCGTAALACDFIKRNPENRAWGVDFDQPTLDWGEEHHASHLGDARDRLSLHCADVLDITEPKVEAVCACNFSYQVFKTREQLRAYFRAAWESLVDDGMFFLDCFGGSEAMDTLDEDREIKPEPRPDGTRFEKFTYVWDQHKFNIVNHHILCHIHFEFQDGTRMDKAFTYDWRYWTLPELQELMVEAGFKNPEVYVEGWDEDEEPDGIFRRRKRMDNIPGWVGYVVGYR